MTGDANEPIGRVLTPCVRNGCLDEDDICMGCYQSISEIVCWREATENDKRKSGTRVLGDVDGDGVADLIT